MRHIEFAYVNLHDFRYEGGAPISSGSQIPVVIDKREYVIDLCFVGVRDGVCLFSAKLRRSYFYLLQ